MYQFSLPGCPNLLFYLTNCTGFSNKCIRLTSTCLTVCLLAHVIGWWHTWNTSHWAMTYVEPRNGREIKKVTGLYNFGFKFYMADGIFHSSVNQKGPTGSPSILRLTEYMSHILTYETADVITCFHIYIYSMVWSWAKYSNLFHQSGYGILEFASIWNQIPLNSSRNWIEVLVFSGGRIWLDFSYHVTSILHSSPPSTT